MHEVRINDCRVQSLVCANRWVIAETKQNKIISYRRDTALQGAL